MNTQFPLSDFYPQPKAWNNPLRHERTDPID
jgi:hypothetical protein